MRELFGWIARVRTLYLYVATITSQDGVQRYGGARVDKSMVALSYVKASVSLGSYDVYQGVLGIQGLC